MIERVLLDMDGVLFNMVGAVFDQFGWDYPTNLTDHTERDHQTSYYIHEVRNIPRSKIWPHLGRKFWANIQPFPWCKEIVSILEQRFGEENICLLTAPIDTDGAIDGKRDLIREHLPQFRHQYLVGPAKQFCASPNHVLVDDHEANVSAFRKAGGHTLLFPAPWNRRYREDPVTSIKEWIRSMEVLAKSRL